MEKQPEPLSALVGDASARRPGKAPSAWLGVLVLAIVVVIVLVWQRSEMGGLREALLQGQTESHDTGARVRGDHELVQSLQGKIEALEAELEEVRKQSDAIEAASRDLLRTRDERVLADTENALSIAVQQLQLAGNVEAALMALQTAEARLATSAQSRFLPLRRLIARDIERLKVLAVADLSGLSLKIEAVVESVDHLPLAFEQRPAHSPQNKPKAESATPALSDPGPVARIGREVWSEFRHLIRIERIDRGEPALLAPEQSYFLRENLRLHLLTTRLSLLQRDTRSYREELRQARSLLERYFDTRAKPVQTALATIEALYQLDPAVPLPALTESLAAARSLKLSRDKTP